MVVSILNGIVYDSIVNLDKLKLLITFDNSAVQANISTEELEIVNEGAVAVREWIGNGLTGGGGIFTGMPIKLIAYDPLGVYAPYTFFDGYIDFTKGYTEISPVKVKLNISKLRGLNDFDTKISALTYGLLFERGAITTADFQTVLTRVIPVDQTMNTMMLAFMEFTMLREIYFISLKIASDISYLPNPGAVISLVLNAIYAALMVVQIYYISKKLAELFFPIPKKNKGITYYTALERVCQYLGYTFVTSISELKRETYLPSRPENTELTKGIPQSEDYGYRCSEMFEIVLTKFDAKIAIVGNTVQLHNKFSPYFSKIATFDINPRISLADNEKKVYNVNEYKANRLITYLTDTTDEYTVKNFTGTNYEIITGPVINGDIKYQLNKGYEKTEIKTALGNSNDVILGFQQTLKNVLQKVDDLLITMKSNIRIGDKFQFSGSPLKVSSTTWSKPKTVMVDRTGNMLRGQRNSLSAKYLWDNYHSKSKSFLPTNKYGQKRLFNEVEIGFGFSDFVKVINNSYFADAIGKMESVKWQFGADTAEVDFWKGEVYTNNLKETYIEP